MGNITSLSVFYHHFYFNPVLLLLVSICTYMVDFIYTFWLLSLKDHVPTPVYVHMNNVNLSLVRHKHSTLRSA